MKVLALALVIALASSAAAQEPPPAPASATAGQWMVFFDWGKPELRNDDQAVLDQVAAAYRARPTTHIQLTGYTDRSGKAAVNRAAGMKRAKTVCGELEKRGIPENAISMTSLGEDQPLVPTEDGVREVQNRRVVILIGE